MYIFSLEFSNLNWNSNLCEFIVFRLLGAVDYFYLASSPQSAFRKRRTVQKSIWVKKTLVCRVLYMEVGVIQ